MKDGWTDYVDGVLETLGEIQRWVGFWGPVVHVPFGLNPAATIAAALALVIVTGTTIASLAILLTSLLFLYLLLTQVFGLRFGLELA